MGSDTLKPIGEIAAKLGIPKEFVEPHGKHKAKIDLDVVGALRSEPSAKYVVVTAITPTPFGEGKTVTTIGCALGLNRIGKTAVVTLRQPSMGPIFGIKGGATGGGRSQVVPMEEINLHLTGDIHAVGVAHNLLAAIIDNHIYHGNTIAIDPPTIVWQRAMDISDRSLRNFCTTHHTKGIEFHCGFIMTVASEIMAALALAGDLQDLRRRIGRMIVARTTAGKPVTAEDLRCAGAMTALLRDAVKPNLLQTIEGTPAFIHAGPFANIAHGSSSIVADAIAARTAEYVVTESGFGADLGFEKFVDIKCRVSGLRPHAAVIVCTLRGLKAHSPRYAVMPGMPLPADIDREDPEAVAAGCANLTKMIEIVNATGINAVVAVNRRQTDTPREIDTVLIEALKAGAFRAVVSDAYARGGDGADDLACAVVEACDQPTPFRYFYDLSLPIKAKIERIAKKCYGAGKISYTPKAEEAIARIDDWGISNLPVCMAKTQLSLSHDPHLKGRPEGFTLPVRDIRISAGAGFVYPILGNIRLMPGLPTQPAAEKIDIDEKGRIIGLS